VPEEGVTDKLSNAISPEALLSACTEKQAAPKTDTVAASQRKEMVLVCIDELLFVFSFSA